MNGSITTLSIPLNSLAKVAIGMIDWEYAENVYAFRLCFENYREYIG